MSAARVGFGVWITMKGGTEQAFGDELHIKLCCMNLGIRMVFVSIVCR